MSKWERTDGGVKAYVKRVNKTIEVEISEAYVGEWLVVVLRDGGTIGYAEYRDICPEHQTPNGFHSYAVARTYGTKLAKALKAANFK